MLPKEDHYYLFLGRSYLEQAKVTDTTADQDSLVLQAETDLKVAQSINPLNTDHTANLARLYTWWAGKATNTATRSERAQKASDYYALAVTISPNNSTLWDEWAILFMKVLGQSQQALERLQHALDLDPKFSYTQGLLGDYYFNTASSQTDASAKQQAILLQRGFTRQQLMSLSIPIPVSKASYLQSFSQVYYPNGEPGSGEFRPNASTTCD